MAKYILIPLSVVLFGCQLFIPQRASQSSPYQVKDVPYKARGSQGVRKRILVPPFLDENLGRTDLTGLISRNAVVDQIIKTNSFVVVSNSDFPEDFSKYKTADNNYDLKKLASMTNTMGIAAVIEGKILDIKVRRLGESVGVFRDLRALVDAKVRIRMVSSSNGKIIMDKVNSATVEARITRVLKDASTDKLIKDDPELVKRAVAAAFLGTVRDLVLAVDKLSWEGRVAMVSGDRIYINAGRMSGLQVGDILKVTEEGHEVYDPETGAYIGNAPGRMKGTLEVISYFGKDGAISILHSGSGIKENDKVELY